MGPWAQSLGRCELKERLEVMGGSVEGMGMGWNTLRPRLLTTGLWDNASSPGTTPFLKDSFIELEREERRGIKREKHRCESETQLGCLLQGPH